MNPLPDVLPGATASLHPTPVAPAVALDDPRVIQAMEEYVAALEAGPRPDPQAFLARYPEIAEALAQCLDGLELVHGVAPQLSPPSREHRADPATEIQPESLLGDYRIVREIGRGGMGVVYEAVQISLGRRVALKVLPFAAALDPKQLRRFKNEAQAAAHLHHTNIVPVHAVGCERGVHFYAMQYIEGQTLAAVIHDLRQLAGSAPANGAGSASAARPRIGEPTGPYVPAPEPAPAPPGAAATLPVAALSTERSTRSPAFFRTVANLGVQAAEALEHAHQQGVIHRDVKPANLLVDAQGRLCITDFGLARLGSDAGLTRTGELLGTLRYMSPEQALAKRVAVDARTDIYSLGVTLYELLTLTPAFNGHDREELLRQIAFEEPRPPRRLNPALPPDLETIVLKAMAKGVEERYATAQELADDLQRFLRQEPVRARRPTLAQRARKWLQRHPSVLVAGSVLLVLLAAGSLLSAWLIRGAYERERDRAAEAEKRFLLARRVADDMVQMAEMADGDFPDEPQARHLRRRMLEAALAYYQEFIEQRQEDPRAQKELELTRDRVKKIIGDLALLQGPGPRFLLNHPAVLEDLGLSQEERGRLATELQRLAEQRNRSLGEFHRLTGAERRQRFLALARAEEAAIATILSPEQAGRLRQIALQIAGPRAFREPDIAAELQLTAEQQARIRAIEEEAFPVQVHWHTRGEPPLEPPPPGPLVPGHPLRLSLGRDRILDVLNRILDVLTVEQKAKWEQLTGRPFTGKMPMGFGVRMAVIEGIGPP